MQEVPSSILGLDRFVPGNSKDDGDGPFLSSFVSCRWRYYHYHLCLQQFLLKYYYRIVRLTLLLSLPIHIDSPHRPSSFRGQVFLKVDHASSAARHLIPECDGQHSVEYGERLAEGISKLLVFDVCK